ncbi:TBC domain-containing protein [Hypoxylon trugodes]|uniref:TBC domain-containing protein n=1 Tax=Hypoxylon trugodes TaxID=326681 RepID=UPI00219B4686|nr:TBC domain-containing protein [Hypoxylon trugodes]KAI1390417.1 TBC domain-containing protein [Hypoxylon trugodes]
MLDHAIMTYGGGHSDGLDLAIPSPGSPPGMTTSAITSRASSVRSFNSDEGDDTIAADVAHFEEIGLDDDVASIDHSHFRDTQIKSAPNPYSASFASDLRAASTKHVGPKIHPQTRDLARPRPRPQLRTAASFSGSRPGAPTLTTQFRDTSTRSLSTGIGPEPQSSPLPIRGLSVRSSSSATASRRRRSPSPSVNLSARSLSPRDNGLVVPKPRRSSWQLGREPKSAIDLEKECDDDDDNIPDDLILDNVPLSPRPPMERSPSRPNSTSTSPERRPKERVRSVGNGTPAVAVAQGCLKSPTWKTDSMSSTDSLRSTSSSSLKTRAKSWTAAISELSPEAKALTEKLEEHADEQNKHGLYPSAYDRPAPKPRVKSALAELPPLRRTNIMIDPLPVSKEKEAVLSRTRPSWLPPKDPAEERRHIKEYQKMMASSVEADKKREAVRKSRERTKDNAAKALMQVWEEDVMKRWDAAIRERRTRELWWKGIAPRSRGAVWSRAIGNELGLTETSFQAALTRVREVEERCATGKGSVEDERKMAWFTQIKTDVQERTWADLKIFQAGAPLHKGLIDVLQAYAMYRSDIGYVFGCNTIAAMLLLNLATPAAAFVALANVLNRPLLFSFYASDIGAKTSAFNLLLQTIAAKSPRLHKHLTNSELGLEPDDYLGEIFTSCFTRHYSLDECTRLWDVYVFEGDAVLIRAAVALLLDVEASLLSANTIVEVRQALEGRSKPDQQEKVDAWMVRVREAGKA